jgi:hypothetical protein
VITDPHTTVKVVSKAFAVLALVWLLGWGLLLLRFPIASFRLLAWGRRPTPKNLKVVRIVGYMGISFGGLFLLEILLGVVSLR